MNKLEKDVSVAVKNPETQCRHCGKTSLKLETKRLRYFCTDCEFIMPIKTSVPLYWHICSKCHKKTLITKSSPRCTFCGEI